MIKPFFRWNKYKPEPRLCLSLVCSDLYTAGVLLIRGHLISEITVHNEEIIYLIAYDN